MPRMNDLTGKPWEIYGLREPGTTPIRYVGFTSKGLKLRLRDRIREARSGDRSYVNTWVRSLLSRGVTPEIVLIDKGFGNGWESVEHKWIAWYRFIYRDKLTNATDGGEGLVGFIPSEETRAKMRKKKNISPEVKERLSELRKNFKHSDSTRAKMKISQLARSPESRIAHANAVRGRKQTPEAIMASSLTRTGAKRTAEQRLRMSEAGKRRVEKERLWKFMAYLMSEPV